MTSEVVFYWSLHLTPIVRHLTMRPFNWCYTSHCESPLRHFNAGNDEFSDTNMVNGVSLLHALM